jgi:hypothetical protein
VIADANEAVAEASFAPYMDNLAEVLEAANADLKTRLLYNYPDSKKTSTPELVEHSFKCTSGHYLSSCGQFLYGWDEISSHHCEMAMLDVDPLESHHWYLR